MLDPFYPVVPDAGWVAKLVDQATAWVREQGVLPDHVIAWGGGSNIDLAKALSVTQLVRRMKNLLEVELGEVWVEGEVSNLKKQASGHWYFSLKDEAAQVRCVMFRSRSQLLPFDSAWWGRAALIDGLPEDSREIVLLYYREEQSSQQVAELLGLSDANVRKKLSRVRELLKDQLLSRYGNLLLSTAPAMPTFLATASLTRGSGAETDLAEREPSSPCSSTSPLGAIAPSAA